MQYAYSEINMKRIRQLLSLMLFSSHCNFSQLLFWDIDFFLLSPSIIPTILF